MTAEQLAEPVFVNILADWNRDADWNDDSGCAPEWARQNHQVGLAVLGGGLAFVGLSRPREGEEYAGLPLLERFEERFCGVWIVDVESGEPRGYLRFEEELRELYDVAILQGMSFPEIADARGDTALEAFSLPG